MKILIGSLTYPLPNGVTVSIETSLDGFRDRGHKMRVVAPEYPVGQVRPEHVAIPSSELGHKFVALFGKEERMFGWRAVGKIKKVAKIFQPDAFWLHTLSWAPNAFERTMLQAKKPKVLTYHTMVEEYGRIYAGAVGAEMMALRSRHVANEMDWVIVPSQTIERKLRDYGVTKPITVIHTGVEVPSQPLTKGELAEQFHFPTTSPLLLMVGRVSKEKNISALLRMLQILSATMPETVLLIIGPGDIDEVSAEAKELGIAKQVVCTGAVSKEIAHRAYGAADAFVFASQSETQGLVISEAMMANTPVVALDSQVREEVYPTNTALIAADEKELAALTHKVLTNHHLKEQLTKTASQFVHKEFSINSMITKQVALFERLTATAPADRNSAAVSIN